MNPRFLDLAEVLEIHKSRIDIYGGKEGIRDIGLLQSAIAQPSSGFDGDYFHADIYLMAAAYLFHISRNHPFLDGNKRTALACCLVFLMYNDIEIETESTNFEELAMQAAQGLIDKEQIAKQLQDYGNCSVPK
jgi:death on curing protein